MRPCKENFEMACSATERLEDKKSPTIQLGASMGAAGSAMTVIVA